MKRISSGGAAAFVLTIMIAILGSGCKENTLIDAKVDPNHNNALTYTMNFGTMTRTVIDDTVITSLSIGGIAQYFALGSISSTADAHFGMQSGSIYFQVIPPITGFHFVGTTIDSAVLILPYSGFTYGDTTDPNATQRYAVYLADSALATGIYYYPFTSVTLGQQLSVSRPISIAGLKDSVLVDGAKQAPHMRIALSKAFINMVQQSADANFSSNAQFLNFIKGIYVTPTDNNCKAMPYFRLDESGAGTNYSKAGIVFYYHGSGQTADTTFSFYYNSSYCSHFNQMQHNSNVNLPAAGTVLLQNQPGNAIDVKIYGLKKLLITDSVTHLLKIPIINKAELDISVVGSGSSTYDSLFYLPPQIYALGVIDSPTFSYTYTIADRYPITSISALSVLDGYIHTNAASNTKTYQLNIPREVQNALINGRDTIHLRLNGRQDYYGAYRLIAGGGDYSDSTRQLKLKVVYSKLK